MEAITRSDMDDYKITRSRELFGERPVSPATINFEMTILRALFYYLICERGISMDNPCARFKPLRSEKERLKGRPPVYKQAELDKISRVQRHRPGNLCATRLDGPAQG